MLQCKYSCRHKHRYLLSINCSLKCGTDSHLCLTKTHIATYKAIHWARRLHIALYRLNSALLVGGLLIAERRLHSLLQVTIGRKSEAFARLTLGIEGNKFARDILDSLLGCSLEFLPRATTQLMHLRSLAIATLIARDTVQRVNIYKENIAITIDQLDNLLTLARNRVRKVNQTVKTTYAIVYMHHIIAYSQSVKFGDGHLLIALNLTIYFIASIAVKYLMLSIQAQAGIIIHKAFVQQQSHHLKFYIRAVKTVENIIQTLHLRPIVGEHITLQSLLSARLNIVSKEGEVFIKLTLRTGVEIDSHRCRTLCNIVLEQEHRFTLQIIDKLATRSYLLCHLLRLLA